MASRRAGLCGGAGAAAPSSSPALFSSPSLSPLRSPSSPTVPSPPPSLAPMLSALSPSPLPHPMPRIQPSPSQAGRTAKVPGTSLTAGSARGQPGRARRRGTHSLTHSLTHSPWRGRAPRAGLRRRLLRCLPLSASGRDPGGAAALPLSPRGAAAALPRGAAPRRAAPSERSAFKCPRRGDLSAAGAGKVPQAPQPLAAAPHVPPRSRYLRVIFLPAPWRKWESWRGPAGR